MKRIAGIVALWIAVLVGGVALSHSNALLPPAGQGDLLDALFGGARRALSEQFFVKADVYFHGGVEHMHEPGGHEHSGHEAPPAHMRGRFHLPGEEEHGHPEQEGETAEHYHGHEPGVGEETHTHEHGPPGFVHVHDAEHEHEMANAGLGPWDVWTRLNLAIHPHEHRHLSGKRYEKELLPWLWASLRCDPHNITAWDVTAYWIAERLDKPQEGLQLIEEGIRWNPDSYRLEFTRGEILLHVLHNMPAALDAFLKAEQKWRTAYRRNPPGKRPDVFDYGHILLYLGAIYQRLGNYDQAEYWFRKALVFRHTHPDAVKHLAEIARLRAGKQTSGKVGSKPNG